MQRWLCILLFGLTLFAWAVQSSRSRRRQNYRDRENYTLQPSGRLNHVVESYSTRISHVVGSPTRRRRNVVRRRRRFGRRRKNRTRPQEDDSTTLTVIFTTPDVTTGTTRISDLTSITDDVIINPVPGQETTTKKMTPFETETAVETTELLTSEKVSTILETTAKQTAQQPAITTDEETTAQRTTIAQTTVIVTQAATTLPQMVTTDEETTAQRTTAAPTTNSPAPTTFKSQMMTTDEPTTAQRTTAAQTTNSQPPPITTGANTLGPITNGNIGTAPNTEGACEIDPPSDFAFAVLNSADFGNGQVCSTCLEVTGPDGSMIVEIIDFCTACELLVSVEVMAILDNSNPTSTSGSWQPVECPSPGNITLNFRAGPNSFNFQFAPNNILCQVDQVVIVTRDNSEIVIPPPTSASNGFYLVSASDLGVNPFTFPFTIRLTNQAGISVEHTLTEFPLNLLEETEVQFSNCF